MLVVIVAFVVLVVFVLVVCVELIVFVRFVALVVLIVLFLLVRFVVLDRLPIIIVEICTYSEKQNTKVSVIQILRHVHFYIKEILVNVGNAIIRTTLRKFNFVENQ